MQRLEVSGAVRLIYRSLGVKELIVEAIDFAHRAVFFVTYWLLFVFVFFRWVRMKGVLKWV